MDPLFKAVDPVFKVEALTLRLTPFVTPASRLILPVTTIFRPVRLMSLVLFAESGAETVTLLEPVVRLRSTPLINDVALPTVMVPEVALEKLTVRLSTNLLLPELPKLKDELTKAPPSVIVIWVRLAMFEPTVRVLLPVPTSPVVSDPVKLELVVNV